MGIQFPGGSFGGNHVRGYADFVTTELGDSVEFMAKARALAIGVDYEPAHLYVIRN
jgi:hypothetical protein